MTGYTIGEISSIVQGRLSGDSQLVVSHLLTDSRKILDPTTSLFIALTGEKRDGHQFVAEAARRGVKAFLVTHIPEGSDDDSLIFITVTDTLNALQQLAAYHRGRFHYPVIGLTGSNGKTIVKEWLNHLLQPDLRVIRSPRSYNSQTGVPLSLWQLHAEADLAIIEAGISTRGEMERLERMIRPEIGIFTNIGEAHSEGFHSRSEKIREKLKLFVNSRLLIYCRDYEDLHQEVSRFAGEHSLQLLSWGREAGEGVQLLRADPQNNTTAIRIRYQQAEYSFSIPFTGDVPMENAVTCAVAMLHLGLGEKIGGRMQTLPSVSMRLEMKNGINRCTVINDSYSNDLSSLRLVLDFLQQQRHHQKKTVILSDIAQSAIPEEKLYREVATLLKQAGVGSLKGIGPGLHTHQHLFQQAGIQTESWLGTEEFLNQYNQAQYRDEIVLIKGARSFGFEQINRLLEMKQHQTVLTIDLKAISENLTAYRRMLKAGTRIMVMVKAFSYGSGSVEIANLLQFHKVDYLAVAYADEGVELRKAGISLPIMVMNPEPSSFASIINYDLQPEIFSFEILEAFRHFLDSEGISEYPVHIKLNTGMNRLGFDLQDTGRLGEDLHRHGSLRVLTVFTHLVGSEDPGEDAYTVEQGRMFARACETLQQQLGYAFIRHIANTSAISRHPDLQLDMVRLGIGLYGVNVSPSAVPGLREAAVLTTTIAQIREVKAGGTVGYNRKGKLDRDSRIATIRIGYADGYPRELGNGRGKVMICNKLFPVVGSVCMDMTMVDITDEPAISLDDDVVIFGRGLSLNQLASWAGTIPYDVMTGISQRVRRVYTED